MDRPTITGEAPGVEEFLGEWYNGLPYISAYTSGSTGTPKHILLRKSDMLISAQATVDEFSLTASSRLGLVLSSDYIAGKMMLVRAIVSGASIYVEKPSSSPLEHYDREAIDLLAVVPSQLQSLLLNPNLRTKVKRMIIGGAPLSPELEKRVLDSGVEAYATYGMTETCSNVALRKVGTDSYKANRRIRFAVDERSCLIINSDVMSFESLVTNDIVELLSDYEFRWLGRFDNVINTGGIKVFPEIIEQKLSAVLPFGKFFITSRPSDKWGYEVIGVYLEESGIDDKLLNDACKGLISYERPKEWISVDKFDYTSSGKLLRKI